MQPAATTDPIGRPTTVTFGCLLLYIHSATTVGASIGETAAGEGTYILPLGVAMAVGYSLLGYFCGKGKNPARIIVWVFGGAAAFNSPLAALTLARMVSHGFYATRPGWDIPLHITTLVIQFTAVITASILLALPVSRPFFRKPSTPRPSLLDAQPTGGDPDLRPTH